MHEHQPWGPGGPRRRGPHFGPSSGLFTSGRFPAPGFGALGNGPKVGRGDVRAAVLTLVAERPLHGYQIIQEIAERSDGIWRPSPGSVYPAVRQLKDEGLVRIEREEGRRVVHLTAAGRAHVAEHADDLDAVWESVTGGVTDDMLELREVFCQLGFAFMQVAQTGTGGQVARARQVLDDTRRSLYQILADGDPDSRRPHTRGAAPR
ncbi:MAG: PadR family transcriptional regulator [Streptomycetales bacterium]